MARPLKMIPLSVILLAMDGDSDALAEVIWNYRWYIRYLAHADENIGCLLENKLLYSIITGFKIRSA